MSSFVCNEPGERNNIPGPYEHGLLAGELPIGPQRAICRFEGNTKEADRKHNACAGPHMHIRGPIGGMNGTFLLPAIARASKHTRTLYAGVLQGPGTATSRHCTWQMQQYQSSTKPLAARIPEGLETDSWAAATW